MTHIDARDHRLVTSLSALGRDDLSLAGGKGANLGELVRAGFPVPDGFVIGTGAYEAAVAAGGLDSLIATGVAAGDGAAIRAAFAGAVLPDELAGAIRAAWAELGGGPVAVRSSATAEDLPGAAFAGQQDTFLNVVGDDEVLDAVRRCWGSLWTDRAIAYRARRRSDPSDVRIAVVVQRMVEAEHAGVMFTANPVTGERSEVVIEASPGLGEAVVSGLVTPEHVVLDADGAVRERVAGRHEVVVRSVAGGGVEHSTATAGLEPLPDDVLADLGNAARGVAAHFGRPQDIEWASAQGRIWLVQARPMTALPPAPLRLNRARRMAALQLMDYMSVRPYPLDVSGWIEPGIGRMVKRMLAEIPGLHVDFADVLPEVDGVVDRFVPPLPRPTRKTLTAPARILRKARRFDPALWTADPRYERFVHAMSELDRIDPRTLGWAELLQLPWRAMATMDAITDLRADYLPAGGIALLRLKVALGLRRQGGRFRELIDGVPTRTEDANRALADLAARVRADPGLLAVVTQLDAAALADRMEDDELGGFRAAWRGFLAEYGHRETVSPLMVTAPTWGADPDIVLDLLRVLVDGDPPAQRDTAAPPPLSPRLRRRVAAARAGIAFREDTHFHGTRVMPLLRRTWLEAGRRLAEAEVLRAADDVFHLRVAEIEAVQDPSRLPAAHIERLRQRARQRAARRDELAGVPMISPATVRPPTAPDADALVSGVPASGGRATGPVRVIRGPEQFGTLRAGEVLVCPYTNPAWTPLFQRAAAVVVDSGGIGSHAAIVAREYGIPAVMGTATGTAVLADGRRVTVDGDRGHVVGAGIS